jgi:hypothetical protein
MTGKGESWLFAGFSYFCGKKWHYMAFSGARYPYPERWWTALMDVNFFSSIFVEIDEDSSYFSDSRWPGSGRKDILGT